MTSQYARIAPKVTALISAEKPDDRAQTAYLIARIAFLTIWHKSPETATTRLRSLLSELAAMGSS